MHSLLLCLATAAFLIGGIGQAQEQFDGQLLSYSQLMSLSRPKRQVYLKRLRQLLIYMESRQLSRDRHYVAADQEKLQNLRSEIALLMRIVSFEPEAAAEPADAPINNRFGRQPIVYQMVFPVYDSSKMIWNCAGGQGKYEFNQDLGTCVRSDSFQSDPTWKDRSGSCARNEQAVYFQESSPDNGLFGVSYCAPLSSLDYLEDSRRAAIAAPSSHAQSLSSLFSDRNRLPAGYKGATSDVTVGGNGSLGARRALADGSAVQAAVDHGASEADAKAAFAPQAEQPSKPVGPDKDKPAPPPAVSENEKPAAPPEKKKVAEHTKKEAKSKPVKKAEQCSPAKISCHELKPGDKNYENAQILARGKNVDACISGGFVSTYKDPGSTRRGCKIVTSFPQDSHTPSKSCGAGQAMCNPWLFSVEIVPASGGASQLDTICVPQNDRKTHYDITNRCNQKFEQYEKLIGKSIKTVNPKTKKPLTVKVKAMDAKDVEASGLKETWEDLVNGTQKFMKEYCLANGADASVKDLFCDECKIMSERIYAMKKEALGTACASTADQSQHHDSGAVNGKASSATTR